MPRPILVCAALLGAALAAPSAHAQERLTLERAVQETLANNPGLRAARSGIDESAAQVSGARAGYFPRVSFVESWQRSDQPVFVFGSLLNARQFGASNFAIDALNHPEATDLFRGAFGVEQLIFDGGRIHSAVDAAERRRDLASLTVDQAAADLALAVTQVYGRLLAAQALQRTADAAVAAAQEDVARAGRRRDAGTATDADVLALTVHLADMRQRTIQASGDAAVARAELNRLMGRAVDREYQAEEPAPAASAAPPELAPLLAEADASRPEIKRAATEVALAEAGARTARAGWWPEVAAQAGYELNGTTFSDRASSWIVGGALRWTLSAGGAEAAQQRAAGAALDRARASADDARAAVHVEVVSALSRLESARAREEVGRSAVDQARESERIVRDRYNAGMAGVTDVLRAATAVLDADGQRVSALVDRVASEAMLRRAVGRKP